MQMGEVRDAVIGIVPEEKWSSWWTAARKNPQIVISGSGAKATYSWSASTGEAEKRSSATSIAPTRKAKLDLARKHSARSKELADYFSAQARRRGREARADAIRRRRGRSLATLEIAARRVHAAARSEIAASPDRWRRASSPPSPTSRCASARSCKCARCIPTGRRSTAKSSSSTKSRASSRSIINALEEAGHTELRDRLIDETLRYPRRHPRAFYWFAKQLNEQETLSEKANYALLFQIIDAINSDEFSAVRARLKDMFDNGGLALRIIIGVDNEEQARASSSRRIDRYGAIEEYRRETVEARRADEVSRTLREPRGGAGLRDGAVLEQKRAELTNLQDRRDPGELEGALQAAREMGDLRENFEYKAARARAEYLSARVGELASEISRVQVLDPAAGRYVDRPRRNESRAGERRRAPRSHHPRTVGVGAGARRLLEPVRRRQSAPRPRHRRPRHVHGQRLPDRIDPHVGGRLAPLQSPHPDGSSSSQDARARLGESAGVDAGSLRASGRTRSPSSASSSRSERRRRSSPVGTPRGSQRVVLLDRRGGVHPAPAALQHARRHGRGRREDGARRPATSSTSCLTASPIR